MADLHARYEAAERLLPHQVKRLVFSGHVKPNWIGGGDRFWYANTTRAGTEFMIVDPESGTRTPALETVERAEALATALGPATDPNNIPIRGLEVRDGEPLRLHVDAQTWLCDPSTPAVKLAPEPAPAYDESISPDGKWAVVLRDYNLVLRQRATGIERPLTRDGIEGYSYGAPPDITASPFLLARVGARLPPTVAWSPDSQRLLTHRTDQRALPLMHIVQSSPEDGSRPRLYSERYAMVGAEAVATAELLVIEVETGNITMAASPPILASYMSPVSSHEAWWDRQSQAVYFLSCDRGERSVRLCALDTSSGAVRTLLEENSDTQLQFHPMWGNTPNVHVLATGETIWWSERSGWGHLYLYAAGRPVRALTSGEWLVRDLVCVDEAKRIAVFTAAGREDEVDPYARQLYRVGLDAGDVVRLSHDTLDHDATGSPSGRLLVDVASWIDAPGVSVLRDTRGEVVLDLEHADAERLYEAGWVPPERFVVKAADKSTDLYGLLFRPHGFDSASTYPVLDDIYPGPQIHNAYVRFPGSGGYLIEHAASMAALGFVVVLVDGRGTPLRGKAFQEHGRGPGEDDNLEDHVTAIRQLASTRPWMDVDRVGIYGRSGGGRISARALLRRPDFFKVAVSVSGNHDDLIYHAMWGEKYIGPADAADYRNHANPTHADRLQGKLMLIHGEVDDNVTPYLTLRLVDALMAANKDFDLLIVPNADHTMMVHMAYWLRRRWDYFVRHLLGVTPPVYRIADIPVELEALDWFHRG